ncbi:recombinase family protein [Christensenellaceae bacterium OttesenSCG-928-M15]|nr:recombinase family protein [Christensenellaceae bacterium OttesenSCG-928-M15]
MDKQILAKYIRLSLDDTQSDSMSIEHQRLILDKYILDSELDGPVQEFVDNGFTGTNFERPGVQELLELVREGKVGAILVKDFSRFGRDAIETGYFIERVFPLYRVRFISVSDHFDSFDYDGDTGGMEVAFKLLMSEYYSKDLSKKISSAKREKARRGEAVTKNCAFGYMLDENRKMVIDPEAAETVRIIFEMYAGHKSIADIEKRLYEDGRPTPAAWKKHRWKTAETEEFRCVWQKSVVLSILYDEQYIGTYIAGKTRTTAVGSANRAANAKEDWIRIPNHHPAIISQELFDTVQEKLRIRGEPHRKRKFGTAQRYSAITSPLKGKVVCGNCGHSMRLSQTKNAAFHCWFTRSAAEAGCHRLRVLGSKLETIVSEVIFQQAAVILNRNDELSRIPASRNSKGESECDFRLNELQRKKQQLYENLVLGTTTPEEYKSQKVAIDIEIGHQQQVHDAICMQNEKNAPSAVSVKAARAALDARVLSSELVDILIERVLIFPNNKIEIVWKVSGFAYGMPDPERRSFVAI